MRNQRKEVKILAQFFPYFDYAGSDSFYCNFFGTFLGNYQPRVSGIFIFSLFSIIFQKCDQEKGLG
ncbi:MAG: hypothetical protein PHN91_02550 [Patescibacteria group bacterium]|nr:hypothetical protein [Patescibacteria group bacterium]